MNLAQILFLALLQGITELFPVSSLGHAVIVPTLLHWRYNQSDPSFVPFLVLLHLGTATALLILYWRDWVLIVRGFVRAAVRGRVEQPAERLAMLLVVGTIPAGALGIVLQDRLKALFANPLEAAGFLIVNGGILFAAERLRRRAERRAAVGELGREEQEEAFGDLGKLSYRAAVLVGAAQALSLLPGISRSGSAMAGGLLAGLRHQEAARFAFLLATPIIGAAGVLEVPYLFAPRVPLGAYLAGAVISGLAAYASAAFLIRYFKVGRLDPYALYSVAIGVVTLALIR
ncbi:MAG TPA: undecaprenyl-diphosphate phosphatase [Candidatus Dormibacteraeota bacterium]